MSFIKAKDMIFRKAATLTVLFFFLFSYLFPREAFATRSGAGGGECAEFDWGDFALAAGMSIGTFAIGGVLNGAISGGWTGLKDIGSGAGTFADMGSKISTGFSSGFSSVFGSTGNFTNTMITGFNTFSASTDVARAVNNIGQYKNWDKQTTWIVSKLATSATGGIINPSAALGNTLGNTGDIASMARGAFVGALTGLGTGGLEMAVDPKSLDEDRSPNALAQIAGFAGGMLASNLGRAMVNPVTYTDAFIGGNNKSSGKSPSVGTVAARLTIAPVVDTLNSWPMIASNALGVLAADQFDENSPWKQPVKSMVSSLGAPLLESTATALNLKPSLAFDGLDTEVLGRQNQLQLARQQWISKGGGSVTEVMKNTVLNWAKYEIPVQVLSGGIQAGMGSLVKDKSLAKQMLLSLGAVAATGIARGAVMYAYNQFRYNEEMRGENIAATGRPNPPPEAIKELKKDGWYRENKDNATYSVSEPKFFNKNDLSGEETKKEDVQKLLEKAAIITHNPQLATALDNKEMTFDQVRSQVAMQLGVNSDIGKQLMDIEARYDIVADPNGNFTKAGESLLYADTVKRIYIPSEGRVVTPESIDYESVLAGLEKKNEGWAISNGKLSPSYLQVYRDANGVEKNVEVKDVLKPTNFATTMAMSLAQSFVEMGSQSASMGLPNTPDGKLETYAWVSYSNNLNSLARSAAALKLTEVAANSVVNAATDVTERAVLTTIADTPLGSVIGMPKFIPVIGYKGNAVTLAAIVDKGKDAMTQRTGGGTIFYPSFPVRKLNVFSADAFYGPFKSKIDTVTAKDGIVSQVNNALESNRASATESIKTAIPQGVR